MRKQHHHCLACYSILVIWLLCPSLARGKGLDDLNTTVHTTTGKGFGATHATLSNALWLNNNRFQLWVQWSNYNDGSSGPGIGVPLTNETGYFWFFQSNNVELMIKVLDGTAANENFWVMFGALSDVEYTITVTDTYTGISKVYTNPAHQLASVADVNAFNGRPSIPGQIYRVDPILGILRYIPAGTFTQGTPASEAGRNSDEGPQFSHQISRDLVVMETEVTRQMWADLKSVQPSLPSDPSNFTSATTLPVDSLTWYEAVLYANLLSVQQGMTRAYYVDSALTAPVTSSNYITDNVYVNWDANGYRLPTEGEWEYFTRAGTTTPFSVSVPGYSASNMNSCTAGVLPELENVAWFCANAGGVTYTVGDKTANPYLKNSRVSPAQYVITHTVGSKAANPWGLKDVHGNVMEWCWDWYAAYPSSPQTDYRGPASGSKRVSLGGYSNSMPFSERSGYRNLSFPPFGRYKTVGNRLVFQEVYWAKAGRK